VVETKQKSISSIIRGITANGALGQEARSGGKSLLPLFVELLHRKPDRKRKETTDC